MDKIPGALVALIPSVKDILSDHAVFPQSELNTEVVEDDPVSALSVPLSVSQHVSQRFHLLPNPALFSLNGVSFGCASVDVLLHLRKEEFFKRMVLRPLKDGDPSGAELLRV